MIIILHFLEYTNGIYYDKYTIGINKGRMYVQKKCKCDYR